MKKLWIKCSKYQCKKEIQMHIFLFFNVIFWILAGFVVSLVVNALTQADVQKAIENIVLFAGYSGVVIGWFGGLLFLMPQN